MKWNKIINTLLILIVSFYAVNIAFDKSKDFEIYKEPQIETKIYTIWHIETFEGGSQSRINYLKQIALNYEKNHNGIYFYIKQLEPETLEYELKNSTPDIISFGQGLGGIVLPKLCALNDNLDIREKFITSGSFDNKLYAYAYIASGYSYIDLGKNTNQTILCGSSKYTNQNPILDNLALTKSSTETFYESYKKFVNNKEMNLLGTARDVFKVNNLQKTGRISVQFSFIDTYTDLIQYIGRTNNDKHCTEILKECLSDTNQQKLVKYNLFSTKNNKIYTEGIYNDMENAIFNCKIERVF